MALIKCKECGKEFSDMAAYCPNCGYNPEKAEALSLGLKPKQDRKNRTVALLITFFLWWIGGDYFYLGDTGLGITALVVGSISVVIGLLPFYLFIRALWAVITFIRIACMSEEAFDNTYNRISK